MTTSTAVLAPVRFTAPLTNPRPQGLYPATMWTEETGPTRWLDSGVEVRGDNYGGENASGVWDADWCTPPALDGPRKEGERPGILDPFAPITVWSYDERDLTAPCRAEVRQRAQQVFRLEEQTAVEREFAERRLADAADTPEGITLAADLTLASAWGLTLLPTEVDALYCWSVSRSGAATRVDNEVDEQ